MLLEDEVYPLPFASMMDLIEAGEPGLARARLALNGKHVPLSSVTLHSPILRPTTLRDAYAFETHVKTANANRGREVPAEWYKFPIFYFTNPNNIFGPDDEIPYPPYTKELDYELEIAVVIGQARPRHPARRCTAAHLRLHHLQRLVCSRYPAGGDEGEPRAWPRARTSPLRSARASSPPMSSKAAPWAAPASMTS